jgi:hypothetical protein
MRVHLPSPVVQSSYTSCHTTLHRSLSQTHSHSPLLVGARGRPPSSPTCHVATRSARGYQLGRLGSLVVEVHDAGPQRGGGCLRLIRSCETRRPRPLLWRHGCPRGGAHSWRSCDGGRGGRDPAHVGPPRWPVRTHRMRLEGLKLILTTQSLKLAG